MPEEDWRTFMELIESRKPQFETLLSKVTQIVERFFVDQGTNTLEAGQIPLQHVSRWLLSETPTDASSLTTDATEPTDCSCLPTPADLEVDVRNMIMDENRSNWTTVGLLPPPPYLVHEEGSTMIPKSASFAGDASSQPCLSADWEGICEHGIGTVSRKDMQSLQPLYDLTDAVLDFLLGLTVFEMLMDPGKADPPAFHIWPSIQINDPTAGGETATWSSQDDVSAFNSARYQLLPFLDSYQWQLAVFDMEKHIILCYDSLCSDGIEFLTYTVGQSKILRGILLVLSIP